MSWETDDGFDPDPDAGFDEDDGGFGFAKQSGFSEASSSQPLEDDEWVTGDLEPVLLSDAVECITPLRQSHDSERRKHLDFIRNHVFTADQLAQRVEEFVLRFYTGSGEWIVDSRDAAFLLLLRYKWNTEKILNLASDNRDLVLCEAGIVAEHPEPHLLPSAHPLSSSQSPPASCPVCWEDVESNSALVCGHQYCAQCWTDHIHAVVCTEAGLEIPCMHPSCNVLVPLSFAERHSCSVCPTPSARNHYLSIVRDYCMKRRIVQCASPPCQLWVENFFEEPGVTCACGFSFCFSCRLNEREFEDHFPVTCRQRYEWGEKEQSLSEDASMNYIKQHARRCPFCNNMQIRVENTCNHIICGRHTHDDSQVVRGCGKAWCWFCRKPWSECGYGCNSTGQEQFQADQNEAEIKAKFLRFFDRYQSTLAWLQKDAATLRAKGLEKAEELHATPESYRHLTTERVDIGALLEEAVETEIAGRKLLLNTYILSYFMNNHPRLEFFQTCQSKIEEVTDKLVEINRKELAALDLKELRKTMLLSREWTKSMKTTIGEILADTPAESSSKEAKPSADAASPSASSSSSSSQQPPPSSPPRRSKNRLRFLRVFRK